MPTTDKNRDGRHSHPQKDSKDQNQAVAQQKNAAGEGNKKKESKAPQEDMGDLGFKTGD